MNRRDFLRGAAALPLLGTAAKAADVKIVNVITDGQIVNRNGALRLFTVGRAKLFRCKMLCPYKEHTFEFNRPADARNDGNILTWDSFILTWATLPHTVEEVLFYDDRMDLISKIPIDLFIDNGSKLNIRYQISAPEIEKLNVNALIKDH